MARENTLAFVLAGGQGSRLFPLTRQRAKPAVPFGGSYRVIDFVLSNLYHSGIPQVCVLTQYKSESLGRHVREGWQHRFGSQRDRFLAMLPATQNETGEGWYVGTAHAVAANVDQIKKQKPEIVNILGGDHINFMDIGQMNDFHRIRKAALTISTIPVPREKAANAYGVLKVDEKGKVLEFQEKPANPAPMPGRPTHCLASMGNYTFNSSTLVKKLEEDAGKDSVSNREAIKENPNFLSSHDFGFDVIPAMLREGLSIFAYDFSTNVVPGISKEDQGYWRDIGNIDEFYLANMDVCASNPGLNLYNEEWELLTNPDHVQPTKFAGRNGSSGHVEDSILAPGVIVSHSHTKDSVISYGVHIHKGSDLEGAVMLGYNNVGRNVVIKQSIIDKGVAIPDNIVIGVNAEADKARGFTVSPGGITVVPKGYKWK
mgnify:CR=1 FL=1